MRYVACPRCGTQVPWSRDSAFKPFCSERCKMADLGAWATEEYRVPAAEEKHAPPTERESEGEG
jgi:endogenous inhibitor of DNA gyrase (YacG/DUF329 family)